MKLAITRNLARKTLFLMADLQYSRFLASLWYISAIFCVIQPSSLISSYYLHLLLHSFSLISNLEPFIYLPPSAALCVCLYLARKRNWILSVPCQKARRALVPFDIQILSDGEHQSY